MRFDDSDATDDLDHDTGSASGPFSGPVNTLLSDAFDTSLDHLSVQHGAGEANRALDARAYTIGTTIALGDGVHDDVNDAASMEVIAHEVAHALAGGGSGDRMIDSGKDDPGELAAHAASGAFRDFIAGGASGPAPRLSPAYGGSAMIHRFEAGEHAHAVNQAVSTLSAAGQQVDPSVAARMQRPITLSNGVTVTQGQITAMMGDFYGAYTRGEDGREHFDPAASFDAMDNADPEEMQRILAMVQREETNVNNAINNGTGHAEHTAPADLEAATVGRHIHTDENGTTTGYSFLELAERNTNHFSTADESGTDNNMGAYSSFHRMAAQAAQEAANMPAGPERDRAEQRALALEASSQHFMTDRFASGHQFDKQQLMDANGGGKEANVRASLVHNEMNEGGERQEGITLHNANGSWQAYGDGEWANANNADNRVHTAQAVAASYGDIDAILNGDATADDMADPTASARPFVPEFDPALNDAAQRRAREATAGDIIEEQAGNIPLVGPFAERAFRNNVLHPAQEWASERWNSVTETAGELWDAGGRAVDRVREGAGEAWDAGGRAVDRVREGAGEAWDAGGRAVDAVQEGAGRAWDSTTETVGETYDAAAAAAAEARRRAAEGWNTVTSWF